MRENFLYMKIKKTKIFVKFFFDFFLILEKYIKGIFEILSKSLKKFQTKFRKNQSFRQNLGKTK